jgi:ATP-dependent Clp protease adaptor protein ClpS
MKNKRSKFKSKIYDVIFFNDHITTMEFVVRVLKQIFGKDHFKAEKMMLRVHEEGEGIVGSYIHEIAGQKKIETTALAEQENFPLKVLIKKHKGTKYEK